MTKQDKIRKGIAKLTEDRFRFPAESAGLDWDRNSNYMLAQDILSYLHDNDVVIKVDDQAIKKELGFIPVGYVAVIPLIKE